MDRVACPADLWGFDPATTCVRRGFRRASWFAVKGTAFRARTSVARHIYRSVDEFSHAPDEYRQTVYDFVLSKLPILPQSLLAVEYHQVTLLGRAPIHVLGCLR